VTTDRGFRLVQAFTKRKPIYEKSWAIVVGINDYSNEQGRLLNAVNDARAVADVLRDTHSFDEIYTLYDHDATRRNIMSWLRDELPNRTSEDDRVLFFFAGHGVTQEGQRGATRGFLVPVDAELGKYVDYIEMQELLFACHTIPAKHILMILDCCFSGVAAVAVRGEPSRTPTQLNDSYLRRITEKHAWQILTAGDKDETVADGGLRSGHSIFTSALLDGLSGEADLNRDGLMTATDLAAYIKPRVARESEVMVGRSQVPYASYLVGSGQGEFAFLVPVPEPESEPSPNELISTPEIIVPSRREISRPIDFDWVTIPAGEFLMGEDRQQHSIYLPEYRIARVPVMNIQYKEFVDATNYQTPSHWNNGQIPDGKGKHPVVKVNWPDALAFCAWAKVRLPTEAEWEKAASWDDKTKKKRVYPWGNKFDAKQCNSRESGNGNTTPVDRYPSGASPYGILEMAGNVWEWTSSEYRDYPYVADDGREKTEGNARRTLRGGSWLISGYGVRCAYRYWLNPVSDYGSYGFRVVLSSPGF